MSLSGYLEALEAWNEANSGGKESAEPTPERERMLAKVMAARGAVH